MIARISAPISAWATRSPYGIRPPSLDRLAKRSAIRRRLASARLGARRTSGGRAGGGADEQQLALPGIVGEGGGAFELAASLIEPAELGEQVAAHAGQQVITLERGL